MMIPTYIVGSRSLELENTHDLDIFVVCPNEKIANLFKNNKDHIDLRITDEQCLYDVLRFKDFNKEQTLFNYQLNGYTFNLNGETITYNILDYLNDLKSYLKYVITTDTFLSNINIVMSVRIPKVFYHLIYNYFIVINKSTKLTEKQKETIQKIHDHKMLKEEYIDLLNKIKEL